MDGCAAYPQVDHMTDSDGMLETEPKGAFIMMEDKGSTHAK